VTWSRRGISVLPANSENEHNLFDVAAKVASPWQYAAARA
jgi:hypothetical protein